MINADRRCDGDHQSKDDETAGQATEQRPNGTIEAQVIARLLAEPADDELVKNDQDRHRKKLELHLKLRPGIAGRTNLLTSPATVIPSRNHGNAYQHGHEREIDDAPPQRLLVAAIPGPCPFSGSAVEPDEAAGGKRLFDQRQLRRSDGWPSAASSFFFRSIPPP